MDLIYYGSDGQAAKKRAAAMRRDKKSVQLRHAVHFSGPERAERVFLMDCVSEHDEARLRVAYGERIDAPKKDEPAGDDCPLSDDELRAAIEEATGEKPHHRLGREKLIAQYNELKAPGE